VPITEDADVARFIPKTITKHGDALVGVVDGNEVSLRGVTYYSRITYDEEPGCYVYNHAVALVYPSHRA